MSSTPTAAEDEARRLLERLHASAVERAGQHKRQLELWEKRASALLEAGPAAKLDLILMQGNADIFEQFRALLQAQRDNCEHESAMLRGWMVKGDGRAREQLQAHAPAVAPASAPPSSLLSEPPCVPPL